VKWQYLVTLALVRRCRKLSLCLVHRPSWYIKNFWLWLSEWRCIRQLKWNGPGSTAGRRRPSCLGRTLRGWQWGRSSRTSPRSGPPASASEQRTRCWRRSTRGRSLPPELFRPGRTSDRRCRRWRRRRSRGRGRRRRRRRRKLCRREATFRSGAKD